MYILLYDLAQALDWGESVDAIKCYKTDASKPDENGDEVQCPSGTCVKFQGIYLSDLKSNQMV